MGVETLSKTRVERCCRENDPSGRLCVDLPFDPLKHAFVEEYIHEGIPSYPLSELYDRLEDGITRNNCALLREALEINPNIPIKNIRINRIQQGNQECIFRIDIDVGDSTFALVAGVSRHPCVNPIIKESHSNIVLARDKEADDLHQYPWSQGYSKVATYPRHYGDCDDADEPYFYLAEFLEGFYEVNVFYRRDEYFGDRVGRNVFLNGFNQGVAGGRLSHEASERLLGDIAEHQLRTAIRCDQVLLAGFRSGDYLATKNGDALMLQCFRKILPGYSGFWARARDIIETNLDPKAELVAYQILSMLSFREDNLVADPGRGYQAGVDFFVYSFENVALAVGKLIDSDLLTETQWNQVYTFLCNATFIVDSMFAKRPFPNDPDGFDSQAMLKRVYDIADFVRFCLAKK